MESSTHEKPVPFAYFLVRNGMEEEIESYQKISKISDEQSNAIKSGNIELLNNLIREKQRLIEQIERIEKRVNPARNTLKDSMGSLSHDILVNLRYVHGTLQTTMDEVKNKDREAMESLCVLKDSVGSQLGTLRQNKTILNNSYFKINNVNNINIPSNPRFFDKKG